MRLELCLPLVRIQKAYTYQTSMLARELVSSILAKQIDLLAVMPNKEMELESLSHICTLSNESIGLNATDEYLNVSYHNNAYHKVTNTVLSNIVSIFLGLLIIDVILSVQCALPPLKIRLYKLCESKIVLKLIVVVIILMSLPFIIFSLFGALCYKAVCSVLIKRNDKSFVRFLDSFDVFWCLEDDVTKSTIIVAGVVESSSAEAILQSIKNKMTYLLRNKKVSKMFCRRYEEYGFYYWRKNYQIDLDQYIQIVEFAEGINKCCFADLEEIMTRISDKSFPYNNEGLFQVLVTKQRVGKYSHERGEYGLIFRIHHSIGDGIALIDLLCRTISDIKRLHSFDTPIVSMPINRQPNISKSIIGILKKLCEVPVCFIDGAVRQPDSNSLHGPALTGKKIFKWTEPDENLLVMVKQIKKSVKNLNFSDVLAIALSNGMQKYFLKTMKQIPEDVAVVLPVRLPKSIMLSNDLKLKNDFSVTVLDLPIKGCNRRVKVKSRCDQLRESASSLTNYYFIKLVCSVLPKIILQNLLNSNQHTLVFSNLPGPDSLTICGGNVLKKLVFFVPHRGNTGLCVTAFTYGGVLRFAIMADAAVVTDPEDLKYILDGMVEEIKQLHEKYVQRH